MTANFKVRAVHKLGFCAKTQHIVQEDGPSSLTKEGIWEGSWTWVETMFAWITLQTRLHWRWVHFSWDGMLRYSDLWIVWIKVYTSFALSTWKLQLQLQFWGSLLSWKLESSPGPHPQPNTIINTYTKSRNYTWIYHGITPNPGCRPKLTVMLRIWLPLDFEKKNEFFLILQQPKSWLSFLHQLEKRASGFLYITNHIHLVKHAINYTVWLSYSP